MGLSIRRESNVRKKLNDRGYIVGTTKMVISEGRKMAQQYRLGDIGSFGLTCVVSAGSLMLNKFLRNLVLK